MSRQEAEEKQGKKSWRHVRGVGRIRLAGMQVKRKQGGWEGSRGTNRDLTTSEGRHC